MPLRPKHNHERTIEQKAQALQISVIENRELHNFFGEQEDDRSLERCLGHILSGLDESLESREGKRQF
jgi:hypothetical protein